MKTLPPLGKLNNELITFNNGNKQNKPMCGDDKVDQGSTFEQLKQYPMTT
jgi:hypothetical protein